MITAQELVTFYQLQPHPEGGYFKETYRAQHVIDILLLHDDFSNKRNLSTAIYFLLEGGQFSAFHRIKSDELWHFYAGDALNIYVIKPGGNMVTIRLGSNIFNGEVVQAVVPAGCWFASRPASDAGFCFVGCTVSPGFDFEDFELANASELIDQYPQHQSIIEPLCRL